MFVRNTLTAARHIVVEGPIGVGKTSLARRISAHIDAQLLLEQPELNPFLSRFYQDQQRFALQTQLFFLIIQQAPHHELYRLQYLWLIKFVMQGLRHYSVLNPKLVKQNSGLMLILGLERMN